MKNPARKYTLVMTNLERLVLSQVALAITPQGIDESRKVVGLLDRMVPLDSPWDPDHPQSLMNPGAITPDRAPLAAPVEDLTLSHLKLLLAGIEAHLSRGQSPAGRSRYLLALYDRINGLADPKPKVMEG